MKLSFRLALPISIWLFVFSNSLFAQSFTSGSVVIVGYNSDNPDTFRFATLTAINSGSVLNFTDNGWVNTGSFRSGEGVLTYTAPSALTAGTTVNWQNAQSITGTGWSSAAPTNFSFNSTGDSLIAYTGTSTLVYALQQGTTWDANATSSATSSEPTAANGGTLTSRVSTNAIGNANGYYSAPLTTGSQTLLQVAVSNATNWTTSSTLTATGSWATGFTVQTTANLFWDANGTTSGTGGTGTWDTITNNTFSSSANTTRFRWVNSSTNNDHTAVFAGTSGTVSVAAGGVTASGLQFDVTGYTIQNNTITLSGTTPTASVTTAGHTATISSQLAGATSLTKTGAGTLILTNANNAYTGATAVNVGTLAVSGSLATSGITVASAAVLQSGTGTATSTKLTTTTAGAGVTLTSGATIQLAVNNASASSNFELNGALNTVNGGTTDTVNILIQNDGLVTYTAYTNITLANYTSTNLTTGTYTNVAPGNFAVDVLGLSIDSWSLSITATQATLTFTPVPEPTTILGLSALGLAVVTMARRRIAKTVFCMWLSLAS